MRRALAALVLAACYGEAPPPTGTSEPTLSIDIGECEGGGSYRSAATDTASAPSVWAEVLPDDSIAVHLDDERANCCPSPHATLATSGSQVTLEFWDVTGSTGCDCMCITDFTVTTWPFLPGDWFFEVHYDDVEQANLTVTVP